MGPAALAAALLLGGCLGPSVPGDGSSGDTGATDAGLAVGSVSGTVVDGAGNAVAGAHVTTLPRGYGAVTDAAGAWQIDLLPPDGYRLVAAAEGFEASTSDAVTVTAYGTAGADLVLGEALDLDSTVTVTVLGPAGEPLAGALVSASSGESGTTDDSGVVALRGLAGAVTLSVSADGVWPRSTEVTVSAAGSLAWPVQLSGRPSDASKYVGSTACAFCHPDQGEPYGHTLHANALSDTPTDALQAMFDGGEVVDLDGPSAALSVSGDDLVVTLTDTTGSAQVWTVTGWIGDVAHGAVPWVEGAEQAFPLPIGWVAGDGVRPGYPLSEDRLVAYQAERWFDGSGHFVGDEPAASASAEAQCFACHSGAFELSLRSDGGVDMEAVKGSGRWVDGAVSCERCHGPGGDHQGASAAEKAWFITQPQLLDVDRARETCGQCHSRILTEDGLEYPWTATLGLFQPGEVLSEWGESDAEHWPSGAAALPRMQLDELVLSPHGDDGAWSFRCFDCHDVHGASVDEDGEMYAHQLKLDPTDNSLCLSCHLSMHFEGAVAVVKDHVAHPLYDPSGPLGEGRCTACHMPPTAGGLEFSDLSGGGDLSSHLFEFRPPQDAIDAFDAAGKTTLSAGEFPAYGCLDCHAWANWDYEDLGLGGLPAPAGDPTLRASHVEYQGAVDEKWP